MPPKPLSPSRFGKGGVRPKQHQQQQTSEIVRAIVQGGGLPAILALLRSTEASLQLHGAVFVLVMLVMLVMLVEL